VRLIPESGPLRIYAAMTLVDYVGSGLYVTGSVLFFTLILGMPTSVVGVGLTVAAAAGLAVGVPAGRLSDRFGPKRVVIACYLFQAVLFAVFPLVRSEIGFVVLVVAIALGEGGARPARRAALSAFVTGKARVKASAYNRAVMNVGFSVGALGGGAALTIGNSTAFAVLLWANSLSFAIAALFFSRLPIPATPRTSSPSRAMMFTPRIVASAICGGILYASASLLDVALPLQVAGETSAPHGIIAALLLVNTVMAIALQVRASEGSETVLGAARANRVAGICLVGACVLFGLSGFVGAVPSIVLLVAATVALTGGELFSSAGQWGMSYALAPEHRQAEFLGGFTLISSGVGVLGPFLATQVVSHGLAGWLTAAGIFAIAGIAAPIIAKPRSVAANRPDAGSSGAAVS
jgi:MFS family permease